MVKVVKVPLISKQKDNNGNEMKYIDVCKILWELQKQTREIKNKTIQLCWEWSGYSSDYKKQFGEYPKEKDTLDYTLNGFIYDKFKTGNDLYSINVSTTTRDVISAFKNSQKEVLRGDKSIISYKNNQPLDLHNRAIILTKKDDKYYFELKLLKRKSTEKYNTGTGLLFEAVIKDNSQKTIMERLYNGIYSISASKLIYNQKKKQWFLNLTYNFTIDEKAIKKLDKDKILGVDLGIVYPICASVKGSLKRFLIQGGEIESFRCKVEMRKKSLQKQGAYCGEGRVGHGYETRMTPLLKLNDRISCFRNTCNNKYSKALIDYAVKNGCGTIQMEDLTGVSKHSDETFLKNWSFYDLQMKIEQKAKEVGIKVNYIKPKYTSQRCSKCGYIDKENRPEQAKFKCKKCGFEENADFNASQNIATPFIDKIIEKEENMQEKKFKIASANV